MNWTVHKRKKAVGKRAKGEFVESFMGYYGTLERACVAVLLDRQGDYGVKDVRGLQEALAETRASLEATIRSWAVPVIPIERLVEEVPA